jgi:hypothetical protein
MDRAALSRGGGGDAAMSAPPPPPRTRTRTRTRDHEGRCRLFAHRLGATAAAAVTVQHRWLTVPELSWLSQTPADGGGGGGGGSQLECGGSELRWTRMWTQQQDALGRPVRRGFGFATTPGQAEFSYNSANNPAGHYRVGVFDQKGRMGPPPPAKLGQAYDSAGRPR